MAVTPDLTDRRLLVVGASSGLGRAIAEAASAAGARVALAARRLPRLTLAALELPGEAREIACDVRAPDDCRRVVSETVAALGGLDALVYAAGMSPLVMLERATAEDWRAVAETNLIGAALVTAAAVPHLRAARGRAVYLSSYAVRRTLPGLGLYRVSKVALDALVEDWRVEHPDVDFTRVVVGSTEGTEFGDAWGEERKREILRVWTERGVFPANTWMPADVLAEAVVSVLALRGYVDDIAVMPRTRDRRAGG